MLGVESLSGGISIGELDVCETLGATSVGVGDDTDGDGRAVLELAAQPVLVDVPGKTTYEKNVGGSREVTLVLDLLASGGSGLSLSLALLGRLLDLGGSRLGLLLRVGVRVR